MKQIYFLLRTNNFSLFFIVVILSILCNFLVNQLFTTEHMLDFYESKVAVGNSLGFIEIQKKWQFLGYFILPIFYLIKFTIITFWFLCYSILFDWKVTFKELFRIVVFAEFVWILTSLMLIVWFNFVVSDYTLNDLNSFAPLSILNLFDISKIDPYLILPLKSLNLFEVLYLLTIALGIKYFTKKDFDLSLTFALPAYGSALLVYIVFITFLSINLGV